MIKANDIIPKVIEVVEREIDRSELVDAQEAFFCGTAWEVTPVVSIDRLPVGDGNVGGIVRSLQDAFQSAVTGNTPHLRDWVTPVYVDAQA